MSWTGGPVEADEEFDVVVQLPDTAGVVLFPAIQLTTEGEVEWIGPEEGEGHDTNPAPRMTLVADPNATTTTAHDDRGAHVDDRRPPRHHGRGGQRRRRRLGRRRG